jgi:GDP-L-fucose synthase
MSYHYLNFVFDKWDGDKPISNCYETGFVRTLGKENIFDIFSISYNFKVVNYRLEEVSQDDNFYYLINYSHNLTNIINEENLHISDDVIKVCKEKNLKLIFFCDHEINVDEKDVMATLISHLHKHKIPESNVYYMNNNAKLQQYKKELNCNLNVFTTRCVFEFICDIMVLTPPKFLDEREFFFLSQNRRIRTHRLFTIAYLKKHNMLKDTDWSFINSFTNSGPIFFSLDDPMFSNYIDYMLELSEIRNKPLKYEESYKIINDNVCMMGELDTYYNSYVNITTESLFEVDEIHITEKSFKPFYFYQLPIFVASHKHVAHMRKMYDFDFFDDLINHKYDDEPNPKLRLFKVMSEVKRLYRNKDMVIDFIKKNKDRLINNHNLLKLHYKENQTVKLFESLTGTKVNNLRLNPIMNYKKVLITGANGLVGTHLVNKCLENGYIVIATDITDTKMPESTRYYFHKLDLTVDGNVEQLIKQSNPDVVFNSFGVKGSPIKAKEQPVDFLYPSFKINTEIINQCAKNDIWLIFVSSVGVYSPAEKFVEEDVWKTLPGQADWFPSWSKRMGEILLESYKVQYGYDKWSIIRPANIFGEYDNFDGTGTVVASTIKKVCDSRNVGEIVSWGDGSPVRDFVYAGDVADAIIKLYEEQHHTTINFGSGEEITIKKLIEDVIEISGKDLKVRWDETKPNGDLRRQMDITKQKEINLLPKMGFKESLKITYLHYKFFLKKEPKLL